MDVILDPSPLLVTSTVSMHSTIGYILPPKPLLSTQSHQIMRTILYTHMRIFASTVIHTKCLVYTHMQISENAHAILHV